MAKIRVNFLLDEEQLEGLKALSGVTRVRMSEYMREGIEMVLAKYRKELAKAKKK